VGKLPTTDAHFRLEYLRRTRNPEPEDMLREGSVIAASPIIFAWLCQRRQDSQTDWARARVWGPVGERLKTLRLRKCIIMY